MHGKGGVHDAKEFFVSQLLQPEHPIDKVINRRHFPVLEMNLLCDDFLVQVVEMEALHVISIIIQSKSIRKGPHSLPFPDEVAAGWDVRPTRLTGGELDEVSQRKGELLGWVTGMDTWWASFAPNILQKSADSYLINNRLFKYMTSSEWESNALLLSDVGVVLMI